MQGMQGMGKGLHQGVRCSPLEWPDELVNVEDRERVE